jgi:hypothetical protein
MGNSVTCEKVLLQPFARDGVDAFVANTEIEQTLDNFLTALTTAILSAICVPKRGRIKAHFRKD